MCNELNRTLLCVHVPCAFGVIFMILITGALAHVLDEAIT